jgi:hypothetical protein
MTEDAAPYFVDRPAAGANYELEFNGEGFRVVEILDTGKRRQVGNGSPDLQLALWSASSALGRRWLILPLKVGEA